MEDASLNIHSENSPYPRSLRSSGSPDFQGDAGTLSPKSYFSRIEVSAKNYGPEVSPAEKVHVFNQPSPVSPIGISRNRTNFKRRINVFQHPTPNGDGFSQEPDAYASTRNRRRFLFFCGILVTIIVALVVTFAVLLTRSKRSFTQALSEYLYDSLIMLIECCSIVQADIELLIFKRGFQW